MSTTYDEAIGYDASIGWDGAESQLLIAVGPRYGPGKPVKPRIDPMVAIRKKRKHDVDIAIALMMLEDA